MNNPTITVLMPAYNAARFIDEAIRSILVQSFTDFEFLIIYEPSTDNTIGLIKKFKDPRIRIVYNEKRIGLAKSLNKGIRLSRGKYIARMDADDISLPNRLYEELSEMERDEELAMVASYFECIDEAGRKLYHKNKHVSAEELFYTIQFFNSIGGHPTVMYKKDIILNIGGYLENTECEDYELWLRLAAKYKIKKIKRILLKYRITKYSKTENNKTKVYYEQFIFVKRNLEKISGKKVRDSLVKLFINGTNVTLNKPPLIYSAITELQIINKNILNMTPVFLNNKKVNYFALKRMLKYRLDYFVCKLLYKSKVIKSFFSYYLYLKHKILMRR